MKRFRSPESTYRLVLILPVAVAMLIAVGLNLLSFLELRNDHLVAVAETAQDQRKLKLNRDVNNQIAAAQLLATDLLDQARTGKIDQSGAYRLHSQLVNQLGALEQQLAKLKEVVGADNLQRLQKDFADYRNAILQATDLAVVDPSSAMSHAFRATLSQQHISQQVRVVAAGINDQMAQRSEARERSFQAHTIKNAVIGGVLMMMMMAAWVLLILRISNRLSTLTSALGDLAKGHVNPLSLPGVQVMSREKGSLLSNLANAVLSFRETSLAHRQAQYDLGERMKELSCLFDVKVITEDWRRDLGDMLGAVAQRLPAAMRFPDIASGWIDYKGQRYGSRTEGEHLSVCFGGPPDQPDLIGLTYSSPLPADAGAAFLAEEKSLFDALAKRLSDVMERRHFEVALAQADRALRTARQCNQLLIRAEQEDQLMQAICRLAVEVGGYQMAWVGMAENDPARSVRPVASAGTEVTYLGTAQISWADVERGRGPTGTAIRERRTVVTRDFLSDPRLSPWRDRSVQRGYGSGVALPLFAEDDRCMGAISFYAKEVDAFSKAEVEQLDEMANDLSFGIRTLRTRAALNANFAEIRKLSLVVEQSPNSIVITNLEPRIEYVNEAFTRNTGFTRDEVLGKNPRLLKSGRTPAATYQDMWKTLLKAQTWMGEFTNHTRQGAEQIEAAIIIPLIQSDGQVSHYVAIKEDITAKRHQEEQLRKLYLAVEQSPESIVITDIEARIEYVNDAFQRSTGYTREEAVGLNPRVLKSGRTPQATYDDMWATLLRGETWQGELFNRRKDGSEYAEFANIAPIRQPDGNITHYLAIKEDITEKKRMSEELERYREHLEELVTSRTAELDAALQEQSALFEAASVGIVLLRERVIVRCNRTLDEMMRYFAGEQIGQNVRIWYLDDAAYTQAGEEVYSRTNRGEVHSVERELVRKDGSHFWARMSGRAIDVTDLSKGMVGIVEDITLERAATAEIKQARALAESASRSKSEFLANMSHEIRTPMNAILGMLYLALRTEITPAQHNYLSKAQNAAHSLLGIINDILDFSKIEAGKLDIEHIEFGLDAVLEQLTNVVGYQAEAKGVEFLIRYDPNIPATLIGDPLRLGQVLANLCSNAVKFTETGEIELSLQAMEVSASDLTLKVSVRDTGLGMSPEVQARLFEKFTQADQTTTRRFGGTGLGLAISKNLVELMHGRIWIDHSQPGLGTTMCFTAKLQVAQRLALVGQAGPLLQGLKALVVDDNEAAREILAEMLRFFQLEVATAANGTVALAVLKSATEHPFDLVLMDWRMPGMNGDQVAQRIHQDASLTHQPKIVMVTAYGREDVMRLSEQAGINGFLIKPVSPSTLLDTVMSVLGRNTVLGKTEPRGITMNVPASGGTLAGARVLLVEDNDINREFASELLRTEGIEVTEAINGKEAVDKVQLQTFDAVLMDIQMPVMDGLKAAVAIRALAQTATESQKVRFTSLPIIAMTALAMAQDAEKVLAAGMNDHITKPIAPERLMASLAHWIKLPPDRAQSSAASADARASPEFPPDLLALHSLDARSGIRRISGRAEAYRKQLKRFREHYADAPEQLQHLLKEQGTEPAEEYCHALKGVTGNLGADALYHQVSALDAQLKQGQKPGQPELAQMRELVAQVIADIDSLQQPQATEQQASGTLLSETELAAQLADLTDALQQDLGAAEDLLEKLLARSVGTVHESAIRDIAEKADAFAIDDAVALVQALRDRLSTPTHEAPL